MAKTHYHWRGYAPIIYKLYLADANESRPPVGTRDLDSLIPRKIPQVSEKSLARHLVEAGFEQIYKDYEIPATESYVKQIDNLEIEIEFITSSNVRVNKEKNVMISGVIAQPLSYLTLSLEKWIPFTTHSEANGTVVAPSAWIFHKGITFPRRVNPPKRIKDLYGIWYVASQLDNFSETAIFELRLLAKQHPKWFKVFQNNIRNWLAEATPVNWRSLESQDPYGKLKRLHFENVLKKLIK